MIPLALLCAASAWLVTRRAPQHRPVAVALSLCAGLDVFRALVTLPPRVDLALALVAPAASLYAYSRTFFPWPYNLMRWSCREEACAWIAAASLVFVLPRPDVWWHWALPTVYTGVIFTTLLDFYTWRLFDGRWTVTHRVAFALLAGDVAGIVLLCRREWISYQAGVVLGLVTVYQVGWYRRSRDAKGI